MVVRTLPEKFDDSAITASKQVSSSSTRINTRETELESLMQRSRNIAPTHHAYYETESGSEFLIIDHAGLDQGKLNRWALKIERT